MEFKWRFARKHETTNALKYLATLVALKFCVDYMITYATFPISTQDKELYGSYGSILLALEYVIGFPYCLS